MAKHKNIPQKTRRKKKHVKRGVVIFFLLLFAVLAALSLTVFFPIGALRVEGKSIYTEEQIIAASGIKPGDNMFLPLFNASRGRITGALPYVRNVYYKYALPDTVIISVKLYSAAFQFKVREEYAVTAKDGTVLEILPEAMADVPIVTVDSLEYKVRKKINFGATADADVFEKLKDAIEKLDVPVGTIDLSDRLNVRFTVNKTTVKLGSATYLDKKMRMVKKMLAEIEKDESGTINVSAWTPENKKGSYMINSQNQ